MTNNEPTTQKPTELNSPIQPSDILNFSSAIFVVIATSIFYFTGWFYLSNWYGFFGIDATALSIPIEIILVHGVPGVLTIIIIGIIATSIVGFSKFVNRTPGFVKEDYFRIITFSYPAGIFMVILTIFMQSFVTFGVITPNGSSINDRSTYKDLFLSFLNANVPIEVVIFLIVTLGISIYLSIMNLVSEFDPVTGSFVPRKNTTEPDPLFHRLFGRLIFTFLVCIEILREKGLKQLLLDISTKKAIKQEVDIRDQEYKEIHFKRSVSAKKSSLQEVGVERFFGGLLLLLYLFVSVSMSSILGVNNAKMGKKSMVGNWQSEATYIFSEVGNLPLPLDKAKSTGGRYVYGPLMILGENGDKYYLTDWIEKFPFKTKPNVYIIQLTEKVNLGIQIIAPTPFPTVSLGLFKNQTPTPIPNITLTPTSTMVIPTP